MSGRELIQIARRSDPEAHLRSALAQIAGSASIVFTRSGREALRQTFVDWRSETGRDEVVVPAYTCYSVAAAAVAAGLRVRLVDVDLLGRIDLHHLKGIPLDRAAGIVVSNLFGLAEPISGICALAGPAGARVLDDAAQSLGATSPGEGPVAGRGLPAVLSFGRGKPLQGLGGGARLIPGPVPGRPTAAATLQGSGGRLAAVMRALAWNVALGPVAFSALAAVPRLQIGATVFDPDFEHGAIEPSALRIAASQIDAFEHRREQRGSRAERWAARIRSETRFRPCVAAPGARGCYARLAVIAPDPASRDEARDRLQAMGVGASSFYPASLADVPALRRHLVGSDPVETSRTLAGRVLTLPTRTDDLERRIDRVVAILAGVGT